MTDPARLVVVLVALQRLAELRVSRAHADSLLARGGVESHPGHHSLFVLLHGCWLGSLFLFVPPGTPARPGFLWLYAVLEALRLWAALSLGPRWTTRVIALPGTPRVRTGPYRWMRHPNYAAVSAQLAVLPLAFGAWPIAAAASCLNAALLAYRIPREEAALG